VKEVERRFGVAAGDLREAFVGEEDAKKEEIMGF
jgi:hypothetical protein